jgi:hypothetical protein
VKLHSYRFKPQPCIKTIRCKPVCAVVTYGLNERVGTLEADSIRDNSAYSYVCFSGSEVKWRLKQCRYVRCMVCHVKYNYSLVEAELPLLVATLQSLSVSSSLIGSATSHTNKH